MTKKKFWTNREISQLLESIAAAYIINQENRFKVNAYQQAANAVENLTLEVRDLWEEKKLDQIPGIGKNIALHLSELFETGKVKHFEKLKKNLPKAMFEFIKIPGVGAKTAYKLAKSLKINKSKNALLSLKKAAQQGKIRLIEGFGKKSEQEILTNLKLALSRAKKKRILFFKAWKTAKEVLAYLKKSKLVVKANVLGSLRRKCSTVGDIDIAVASNSAPKVIKLFVSFPKTLKIIEAGQNKARILLANQQTVDLRVISPDFYGSLLQHFTGSKLHNIHLREIALKQGLSLSEYGIKKLKIQNSKLLKFKNEKSFYQALGMEWIPPELREDTGEIEAAKKKLLPKLIKLSDIKGDLHLHSNFNIETSHDLGKNSIKEFAKKARNLGYEYISFSEHNPSISKHSEKQIITILKRKKRLIEQLNCSRRKKLFIFNSLEIDIKPNGDRAITNKALDLLDFAIVSVHSSFNLSKEKMTQRVLKALNHPKIKIFAHPTGRLLNKRRGYDLNWYKIFNFCLKNNKFIEINSSIKRLDLPDFLIREAVKKGVKLVINTDSHSLDQLDNMVYGVNTARRGWTEKNDIINTSSLEIVKKWLIND